MTTLEEFVAAEKAVQEEQRKAYVDQQNFDPFVKWAQGVTEFTLEPVIPRDHLSFSKPVKVFSITIEGDSFDWSINPRSPMYGEVLDKLLEAPVALRINRMGENLDTRYDLLP